MVVEHTFVTTLEAPVALRAASVLLGQFGFAAQAQTVFQMEGDWNTLEMHRGVTKYRRSRGVRHWPQQVRLEWDRGRVDVAVSITPPSRGRFDSNSGKLRKKENAAVQQLLLSIAQALELLLASKVPAEQAENVLRQLDLQLEEDARRSRRRSRIILVVVLAFFVICIGALVVAIISTMPGHHW
jgi:hypothetical protein